MRLISFKTIVLIFTLAVTAGCLSPRAGNDGDVSAESLCPDTSRPLGEVLNQVAADFGCTIIHDIVPPSQMLRDADFRIRPWSIRATLDAVLTPCGYEYSYSRSKNSYRVKYLGAYRRTPGEGAEMMEWLASRWTDREAWQARRDTLRSDIRHNLRLDILPEHFDGGVILSEPRRYEGYSVQNIGLEILPGVWCSGSIFRPAAASEGPRPLMLNPHGHNQAGRSREQEQIRAAMWAQLGCYAVSWDMLGKGCQPYIDPRYHRTPMTQTYNVLCAMRLLDYMTAHEAIDSTRIGITGASGGGTQTMLVTAVDSRITLSIPAVMMSCYHNGGCPCESGTGVHFSGGRTNNVEIAALCAPNPMLVISDGADWTAHNPDLEMPYLKRIYRLYGAEDQVQNAHFPGEGHDYGPSKRQAAYAFTARHWGLETAVEEAPAVVEPDSLLCVWGPGYSKLPHGAIRDPRTLASALGWKE